MAFKMKKPAFYNVGNEYRKQNPSAVFQQKEEKKYPEGYTKEDIRFLEEQHEEPVRRSDFEEGSIQQKMFDCNQDPKTKWNNKTKKCEPIKKKKKKTKKED